MQPAGEFELVATAAHYLRKQLPFTPRVGVILGTGLGQAVADLEIVADIPTRDVPGMIPPTVESHRGHVSLARWRDLPVAILSGRIHYYEGHTMAEVVRPVRILRALGCTHLVTTNAAGGLNPGYDAGDIVLLRDHINLMPENPLRGPNENRWGPRFPDMSDAYDMAWLEDTIRIAADAGIRLHRGVYAGLPGPSLETPAEYLYLHRIGADLVGMSAVPEVIAARHAGLRVLGISVVSNVCYPPERIVKTTVEDVIRTVEGGAVRVRDVLDAAMASVTA